MNAPLAQRHSGSNDAESTLPVAAPVLSSSELLKGSKSIGIEHKGAFYRLQETKLGKLILTK